MSHALDLTKLTSIALDVARDAAQHVARGHRSRPSYDRKHSHADLVTRFDLESEQLIRRLLAERTPELAIIGEEQGGEDDGRPSWLVDPIDGTTNFAHGHPFYAVSIGLTHEGLPLLGAVVAPALACEWHGFVGAGGGAFRNGERCTVTAQSTLSDCLVATGFSPMVRGLGQPEDNLAAFLRVAPHVRDMRRCGSAALDLCMVADGTYDAFWERRLGAWDVAAGAAIVLAAGGQITDLTGAPCDFRHGYLLASNGHVHADLVGMLAVDGAPTWAPDTIA